MKNFPKKDQEKKILSCGILVPKQVSTSFNLIKQDGSQSPDQRLKDEFGFYIPKTARLQQSPLSTQYQRHPSYSTFEKNNGKNRSPDTATLLNRMGYGLSQGTQMSSTSLLASEREIQMKKRNANLNNSLKNIAGSSSNLFLKTGGIDTTVNEGETALPANKEDILSRFQQRALQNTNKRSNLVQIINNYQNQSSETSNYHFEEIKKKLQHWNQISNILDTEIEEKLNSSGSELIGLAERYTQINGFIASFFKALFGEWAKSLNKIEKQKVKLSELQNKIAEITTQKDQLTVMFREKSNALKKILDVGGMDEVKVNKDRRENYLTFENSKLAAENQQLAEKLKILETGADIAVLRDQVATLKKENETITSQFMKDLENRDRDIQKRRVVLATLQGNFSKVEFEAKQLRIILEEQQTELENIKEENMNNFNLANTYRERTLMTQEDYSGMLIKTQDHSKLVATLRDKSNVTKAKLDRFMIAKSKEVEFSSDNNSIEEERSLMKLMMEGEIGKDKTFFKKLAVDVARQKINKISDWKEYGEIGEKFSDTLEQMCFEKEVKKKLHPKDGGIFLPGLQLQRASFFTLIETAAKNFEIDIKSLKSRKISLGFIGVMRAILDSKYNELILLEGQNKQVSRFADFTYSWLGKFIVDQSSREIRLLKESERVTVDDSRVLFFLDLWNPKFGGIWEIETFREFLSEKAASDEIFFYLHCRNILFKGPSLIRHESTFDVYQYMSTESCDQLIDLILIKFDPVNIILVKKQLKEKVIVKNGKQFHASGFILRLLLEFYRQERKNRYKLLKEVFLANSTVTPDGKFQIPFRSFKKIISLNFNEATETEIAHIYRDAYSLGSGNVTIDTFYAIANDQNFFLKFIHLNSNITIPVLDSNRNFASPKSQKSSKLGSRSEISESEEDDLNLPYKYFYSLMEPLKQAQEYLLSESLALGIDKLYNEVEEANYQINHKFQQNVPELKGRPFFLQIQKIITLWYSVKSLRAFNYYLLPKEQNYGLDCNRIIVKDFECASHLISELETFENHKKMYQLEKNNKFRKLQKMCRKKISKFYQFISSLLSAKLKGSMREQKVAKKNIKPSDLKESETPTVGGSSKKILNQKQK